MREEQVYHILDDRDISVGWCRDISFAHRFCNSMNLGLEENIYRVKVLGVDYGKYREENNRK